MSCGDMIKELDKVLSECAIGDENGATFWKSQFFGEVTFKKSQIPFLICFLKKGQSLLGQI